MFQNKYDLTKNIKITEIYNIENFQTDKIENISGEFIRSLKIIERHNGNFNVKCVWWKPVAKMAWLGFQHCKYDLEFEMENQPKSDLRLKCTRTVW